MSLNASDQQSWSAKLALYLVADPELSRRPIVEVVGASVSSGVTAVQLRAKTLSDRETFALAEQLARVCHSSGALFFVNDRIDIALACRADGVHLGVDDLPLHAARRLASAEFLIGWSPENDDQTRAAKAAGADFLGVGPVFGTTSKSDAGSAIGLDTFARRVSIAGIPVIGIGGITTSNAKKVIAAGAVGVAVVSAILSATDCADASARLSEQVRLSLGQN